MNKLIPEYNQERLRLYNKERVVIENFKELKDISNEMIVVDNYMIIGSFLKINRMDPLTMEIYGQIKEIIIS